MSEYDIVIYDDGVEMDRETEAALDDARVTAETLISYWQERRPRGDYAWTIYNTENDDVEYSE